MKRGRIAGVARLARLAILASLATLAGAGIFGVAPACSTFSADAPAHGGGDVDADAALAADVTPDTSEPVESGLDAGAGLGCPSNASDAAHFCDDFDHAGAVALSWDESVVSGGGRIGETDAARSPPRAIVFHLAPGDGMTAGFALLLDHRGTKVDVSTKNRMTVGFSLRVDKPPYATQTGGNGFMHLAVLEFDTPICPTSGTAAERAVEITTTPNGGIYLNEKGLRDVCQDAGDFFATAGPYPFAKLTPESGFHRFTIEVSRASCPGMTGGSLRATVDDATYMPCTPLGTGDPFAHAATLVLRLGPYTLGTAWAETELTYDDVTFDFD